MNEDVDGIIAKHSYIILTALFISTLFNYLYQVLMGNFLSNSDYGILGVSLSIFYIAVILTQSTFSQSSARLISADPFNTGVYFKTTILGNFLVGVAVSLAIFLYSLSSEVYFLPLSMVAILLLITSFVNSITALHRGHKRFENLAIANVLGSSVKLVSALLLVFLGFGVLGALASFIISLVLVIAYLFTKTLKIDLGNSKGWSFSMLKETIPVSIVFLGLAFLVNGSIVLFRYFEGSDVTAGSFNAALTVSRGTYFFSTALITVLFPYLASEKSKEYFSFQSLKYAFLFVFPLSISMLSNPGMWLNLFFSTKYLNADYFLIFLSISVGLLSIANVLASNLIAMERFSASSLSLLISSAVFIVLTLLTRNILESLLVTSLVVFLILFVYYLRSFYFKFSFYYSSRIVLSYLAFGLITHYLPLISRFYSLVEIVLSFAIYFVLISVLRLFDERDVLTILSPFPERLTKITANIIRMFNSLL